MQPPTLPQYNDTSVSMEQMMDAGTIMLRSFPGTEYKGCLPAAMATMYRGGYGRFTLFYSVCIAGQEISVWLWKTYDRGLSHIALGGSLSHTHNEDVSPSSSSLTSLAALTPSSFRFFSICLLLSSAALSSALRVQPMTARGSRVRRERGGGVPGPFSRRLIREGGGGDGFAS